jgi:hypothetical protein
MNELNWNPHPAGLGGTIAKIFYPNGYGASVILGSAFYSNGIDTYELAVLKGTSTDWDLTYDTPITDDVLGRLSELDVLNTLKLIEELPSG